MTDISITPASVVAGADARKQDMIAGTTITAGQVVYRDSATGQALLADCDSATAAARIPIGIALNGAAEDQPVSVLLSGLVTIGATLTAGTDYWLSGTAGGICPRGDLTVGDRPVLIGIATTTAVMKISIIDSTVTL